MHYCRLSVFSCPRPLLQRDGNSQFRHAVMNYHLPYHIPWNRMCLEQRIGRVGRIGRPLVFAPSDKPACGSVLPARFALPAFRGPWQVKRFGRIADRCQVATISAKIFETGGFPVCESDESIGWYNPSWRDGWQPAFAGWGSTGETLDMAVGKCWIANNR